MSIQTPYDGSEDLQARIAEAIRAVDDLDVTDRVRAYLKSLAESNVGAVEEMLTESPDFFADLDTELQHVLLVRQIES